MYMYTHGNVRVASPAAAAANGTRKGPMAVENPAGKLDISAVYSTSCPYDICICQIKFFCKLIICLVGDMNGGTKTGRTPQAKEGSA